jgi:hypothetical protein
MNNTTHKNKMWITGAVVFALAAAVAMVGNTAFADEGVQATEASDHASDGVKAGKAKYQTPWVYRHRNHRHKLPIHKGLKPSFTKKRDAAKASDTVVQETSKTTGHDVKAESAHKEHESKKEVHPTKAYFVSWSAMILSLRNSVSRKP